MSSLMFVRCKGRFKHGMEHHNWSVAENSRVSGRPGRAASDPVSRRDQRRPARDAINQRKREWYGLIRQYECWTLQGPNPGSNATRIENSTRSCSPVFAFWRWHHRPFRPSRLRARHRNVDVHRDRSAKDAATVELLQVLRGFQLRLRRNWFLKFFSPSITSASTMSSTPCM